MKSALETAVEEREMNIAQIMIANHEPDEKIALYTGLSLSQIEQMRRKLPKK